MTHLVRHDARRRVPARDAGADTKNFSERGASMQTPHVNQTAWNGNNRTFAWETMTMIEAPDAALAPRARSHRRRVGAERVHFVDPPKTIPESRRKLPINLPAFLEEPLSRLPERR